MQEKNVTPYNSVHSANNRSCFSALGRKGVAKHEHNHFDYKKVQHLSLKQTKARSSHLFTQKTTILSKNKRASVCELNLFSLGSHCSGYHL